jgi:hypothetical protein
MNLNFLRHLPKDKLQKIVLTWIVTLSAVVGVVQGYVLKDWSALNDTRRRVAQLNEQIQQAERKAREAAQDVVQRDRVKSFVQAQQAAMIAGDPFAWVVREISLLAEQHPVHVLGMRSGGKGQNVTKSSYDVFTAQIEVEAGYDELGVFLQDFENKFPTAEVRSLSIVSIDDTHPERRATIELAFLVRPDTDLCKGETKPIVKKEAS